MKLKKTAVIGTAVLSVILLLSACSAEERPEAAERLPYTEGDIIEGGQAVMSSGGDRYEVLMCTTADIGKGMSSKDRQKREALGLTDEGIRSQMEQQKGNYAYDILAEALKPLYAEILTVLNAREKGIIVSSTNDKEIDFVFQCVLNDHPEIFYVKGYTYTKYTRDNEVQRISFTGTYTMGEEEIAKMQAGIEEYSSVCIAGVPENADDYTKVKYVYEYIIANTEYDLRAKENQNICSVCIYGESVCQGYAKTMQFLLNRLSIPTTLVIGTVDGGEGHAWNLVKIDGEYYYVDSTWGDAYYVFGQDENQIDEENLPTINYDYLCVTTEQLSKTHKIDNVVPMPKCLSLNANYYVKEGTYFTEYDEVKIAALFRNAYSAGSSYVTLKCDSRAVYEQLKKTLITDQAVFGYLESTTKKVAFTNSEVQLTLSFWL